MAVLTMPFFVYFPECEKHYCDYYIDGNIGEGLLTCFLIVFALLPSMIFGYFLFCMNTCLYVHLHVSIYICLDFYRLITS